MSLGEFDSNLLLGATGFVGGHLVEYLFQQGEISKGAFRKGAYLKIMDGNGVQGVEADLLDHNSLHEAVEGVDTIYSLASPMPYGDEGFEEVNSKGMLNVLEVARETGVKCIVHLSTIDVYGFDAGPVTVDTEPKPRGAYQQSKLTADRLLLDAAAGGKAPRIAIVRAARAIGARDSTLSVPLIQMAQAGSVTIPGSRALSFTHPKDIAQAMYRSATSPLPSGKTYLVKSFDAAPVELAAAISRALGLEARTKSEGLLSRSRLPRYTSDQLRAGLRFEGPLNWDEFGYTPLFGLSQTCEEIANWHRKEPWVAQGA